MPNQTEFPFANARRISESEVIANEDLTTKGLIKLATVAQIV